MQNTMRIRTVTNKVILESFARVKQQRELIVSSKAHILIIFISFLYLE